MREYASLTRERDRNDGVLGLVDRERDRELDRNMVDREVASRRDMRMMGLLDRERERDRGGTDVMGLLERELERKRDVRLPHSTKKLKAKEEPDSDDDRGLRAEIEALRKDFKRLMKSPSTPRNGNGSDRGSSGASGTRPRSRVAGRQRPSAVVEVQFSPGDDAEDDSRNGDNVEEEDEDDSAASTRDARDVSGQGIRRAGRSLRRANRREDASDSEES